MKSKTISAPDLTGRPPRSPRVRLGGYVILPRCLDKGRALLAGKNGEYNFDCPLDQRFLEFVGIKGPDLKRQLASGKGDGEILQWIEAHAKIQRTPWEIGQWSAFQEQRGPSDLKAHQRFAARVEQLGPTRTDLVALFDLLDLDDYISFGGKA